MAGARTAKARSAHAASVDHLGTHSPRDSAESGDNGRLGNPRSDSRNRRNARVLPGSRRPALARRGSVRRTVKEAKVRYITAIERAPTGRFERVPTAQRKGIAGSSGTRTR